MIDTSTLKDKILMLAVTGKLCEQIDDESAIELLSLIEDTKKKLLDAGIIKKEKKLAPIKDEEIPYTIPHNWKWVRLGDYCQKVTDQVASGSFADLRENVPSLKEPNYAIMVKTADFANGFTSNLTYTDKKGYEFLSNSNLFGGELILSNIGSIGKCFIVPDLGNPMTLAPNAVMIRLTDDRLRNYLYYFILSRQGLLELEDISTGVAVKKFNKTDLKKILIPVPPLKEQERIVEKLNLVFSELDEIDKLQASYISDFNVLKRTIIDDAIRGKLTDQIKQDGTADELFCKIQEEKKRLIREGKIKKEKFENETKVEGSFCIPDNWRWVSVGEVCANIMYGTSKKSQKEGKIPVIRMGNLQNGLIKYDNLVYSSDDEEIEQYRLEYNDLLFNRTNSWELVGKTAIYKAEVPAIYAGYLIRMTPILINADYLNYVMQSGYYWKYCDSVKIGAVNQANINAQKLKAFVFPLPPLDEQERIVIKIGELEAQIELLNNE